MSKNESDADTPTENDNALRTWLDDASPTEAERATAAEAAWSKRRASPVVAVVLTAAAAAALGTWALWDRSPPPRAPEYGSSLVMHVGGNDDEIRIEVGVRRERDES